MGEARGGEKMFGNENVDALSKNMVLDDDASTGASESQPSRTGTKGRLTTLWPVDKNGKRYQKARMLVNFHLIIPLCFWRI
jgi:hypothetical protein